MKSSKSVQSIKKIKKKKRFFVSFLFSPIPREQKLNLASNPTVCTLVHLSNNHNFLKIFFIPEYILTTTFNTDMPQNNKDLKAFQNGKHWRSQSKCSSLRSLIWHCLLLHDCLHTYDSWTKTKLKIKVLIVLKARKLRIRDNTRGRTRSLETFDLMKGHIGYYEVSFD